MIARGLAKNLTEFATQLLGNEGQAVYVLKSRHETPSVATLLQLHQSLSARGQHDLAVEVYGMMTVKAAQKNNPRKQPKVKETDQ
jgi:hypothetical protein